VHNVWVGFSRLFKDWREHAAGATPLGPEVNRYQTGFASYFIKVAQG
jgi:hypothetical protein